MGIMKNQFFTKNKGGLQQLLEPAALPVSVELENKPYTYKITACSSETNLTPEESMLMHLLEPYEYIGEKDLTALIARKPNFSNIGLLLNQHTTYLNDARTYFCLQSNSQAILTSLLLKNLLEKTVDCIPTIKKEQDRGFRS